MHLKPRKYFAGADISSAIEGGKNPSFIGLCCNGHCSLIPVLKAQQWLLCKVEIVKALKKNPQNPTWKIVVFSHSGLQSVCQTQVTKYFTKLRIN